MENSAVINNQPLPVNYFSSEMQGAGRMATEVPAFALFHSEPGGQARARLRNPLARVFFALGCLGAPEGSRPEASATPSRRASPITQHVSVMQKADMEFRSGDIASRLDELLLQFERCGATDDVGAKVNDAVRLIKNAAHGHYKMEASARHSCPLGSVQTLCERIVQKTENPDALAACIRSWMEAYPALAADKDVTRVLTILQDAALYRNIARG